MGSKFKNITLKEIFNFRLTQCKCGKTLY